MKLGPPYPEPLLDMLRMIRRVGILDNTWIITKSWCGVYFMNAAAGTPVI